MKLQGTSHRFARWFMLGIVGVLAVTGVAAAGDRPAEQLRSALSEYRSDAPRIGRLTASDAFFAFEDSSLDKALAARSPALYQRIESEWTALIGEMGAGVSESDVRARGQEILGLLQLAETAASEESLFLDSFLIILREGFEAILVVSALAAYLVRSGHGARLPFLYGGAVLAVFASLGLWLAARTVIEVSGIAREALEGWTMLLATAVLFWVSYWLLSKAEMDRWHAFVQRKVDLALGRGALAGLTFLSFVVVFREGFETVLFYEAIAARAPDATPILAGFGVGLAALVMVYVGIRRVGNRLPVRLFFTVTGVLLYFLAFKFAGAGVFELQVAQVLAQTPVPNFPDSAFLRSWFGVFPYVEPLALQGVLVVLAAVAWLVSRTAREPGVATSAPIPLGRRS
jgi:high-affinity iron transporter